MMHEFKSFLTPLIEDFIFYRRAANNWNKSYENNLYYFDNYCYLNYPNESVLTQEMVDEWCAKHEAEVNKSCTTRIYVVIQFVRYLRERYKINVIEPSLLKDDNRKPQPHAFTNAELKNFFYACDVFCPKPKTRTQHIRKLNVPTFFRLLYSTGMRPIEVRLLKVEDVDFEQGVLNIRKTKGYNQHFVVLHDSMFELLKRYNKAIEKYCPDRNYFFTSDQNSYYSKSWVSNNCKEMWSKYNDAIDVVPYTFRHHYAITNINKWIGKGFDFYDKLLYLSKSMGHTTLESTKYYYSLVPALADILEEKTGEDFNDIIPEVEENEKDQ